MIHAVTEAQVDAKLGVLFNEEVKRIGVHAKKLGDAYNAIQLQFRYDNEIRMQTKLCLCLTILSMRHDADSRLVDEFFLTNGFHRLFYDIVSEHTNKWVNKQITYVQYIEACARTQDQFVNRTPETEELERIGCLFAAASRDSNSPFFGMHELTKQVFLKLKQLRQIDGNS